MLTNQTAKKNGTTTLLDLSYEYNRLGSAGNLNGKTGHLTRIIDNLNNNKNREYEFDAVGRLLASWGGPNKSLSVQAYAYDRYGNRTSVYVNGIAADGSLMPMDGIPNLTYDNTSNRITTAGFEYDVAGNQIKSKAEDGSWLRYEYDAANRLRIVKRDSDGSGVQSFQFGSTNQRLMDHDHISNQLKIIAGDGGVEYTEFTTNIPTWTKSYVYLGARLLSTITSNGTGAEFTEYNHPDKLSTRLVTNQAGSYEQVHLPFGTALNAETTGTTTKRFTSYERSQSTGLDYAINRTYDSKLGRFTQVDPIGMQAVDINNPQTLNLYNYCGNDPVNHTDPDGQFFFALFSWLIGGLIGAAIASKKVRHALVVAFRAVASVLNNQWVQLGFLVLDFILPGISKVASGLAKVLSAINKAYQTASNIMGMIQIGAMIVEAQWKQLGVTLGLAAALAPLTAIMDGIKKGVQNRLFRGDFDELADLFRGAWAGFKDGWRFFKEGLKRKGWKALIPFYGNRCGPDYGDDPTTPGINSFDSNVCGAHDDASAAIRKNKDYRNPATGRYNAIGYRKKFFADLRFLGRSLIYGAGPHAVDLAFGRRPSLGARYKVLSSPAFGLRSIFYGFRSLNAR